MSKMDELVGTRCGRLMILEDAGRDSYGKRLFRCRCDCGNEIVTEGWALAAGKRKSCGCAGNNQKWLEEHREEKKAAQTAREKRKPWTDCNRYSEEDGICKALTEMMCVSRGYCKFYKKLEDAE